MSESNVRNERRLATVYFTWDELEVLAEGIDELLKRPFGDTPYDITGSPRFGILNSLRTSLREAQFAVRPDRQHMGWTHRRG